MTLLKCSRMVPRLPIWPEGITVEENKVPKYYLLRSDVSADLKAAFSASIAQVATESLAKGLPTYGISAQLAETESFSFGGTDGIQLGDTVTIRTITGDLLTDRITRADFEFGNGTFKVTPYMGDVRDDPNTQLAQTIADLAHGQRRISKDR